MSACPRSAARINEVPRKLSRLATSAPLASVRSSSSTYPSLAAM